MGTESIISLSEAVRRLGIHIDLNDGPLVDTNRKTADIMCPMCSPQHRTKRRTLNLDFTKNVFGCIAAISEAEYISSLRHIRIGLIQKLLKE